MTESDLISPLVAALILQVNPRTVARWADDGLLGIVEFTDGGQRRLSRDAVEHYAAQRAAS